MPATKWSRGATRALNRIKKNRKTDLDEALQDVDREPGPPRCTGRNKAVKARVHVEYWRNGFKDDVLQDAHSYALSAYRFDKDDFYTNWKMAYTLKYLARSRSWSYMTEAMSYYAQALASLQAQEPGNVDALRCVLFDRAEAFVYLSQPDVALAEMTSAPGGKVHDWHTWARAFAEHQNGAYSDSVKTLKPLIAGKPDKDLYYNDVRLLLAASQARAGETDAAEQTIKAFRRNRDCEQERVWTITLELERGAFYPDSLGEKHWRQSLCLLDEDALPR